MDSSFSRQFPDVFNQPRTHRRVLGPPASGKTSFLVELYLHLQKQWTGTGRVRIITFSRDSRDRLLDLVLPSGQGWIGRPPVVTYHGLAREVLDDAGKSPLRTVGEMEQLVLLEDFLRRGVGRLGSDYEDIKWSEKFHREVLGAFKRLIQNRIGRKDAARMLEDGNGGARAADILQMYLRFSEWLEEQRAATDYTLSWLAADAAGGKHQAAVGQEAKVLLIDDFQDVDPGQYEMIRAVAPPDGNAALIVFGDPAGARFRRRGTDDRFLKTALVEDYAPETIYLPHRPPAGTDLDRASRAMLRDAGVSDFENYLPAMEPDEPVELHYAQPADEFEEAHLIAAWVEELLRAGLEPGDIALVCRKKRQYEPALAAAFGMRGIPLETGRRRQSSIENVTYHLLRIAAREQEDTSLEFITASPLFDRLREFWLEWPELDPPESDAGLVAAVVSEIRRNIAGKAASHRAARKWLELVVARLIPPDLINGEPSRPLSPAAFFSILLAGWQRFVDALEAVRIKPKLSHLGDFLQKSELFSDRLSPVVPAPGRVGLYSVREIGGRRFPVVCLPGCSEMIFPAPKEGDSLIPYQKLERLMNDGNKGRDIQLYENRSVESHLRDEFALMALAFSRSSRHLFVTAPGRFGGRLETGPADVLAALSTAETGAPPRPPAMRAAVCLTGLEGMGDKELAAELEKTAAGQTPVPLLWLSPRPDKRPLSLKPRPLSPSALKAYDQCERKYFYSRILKLPGPASLAMNLGNWFHQVMNELAAGRPTQAQFHQAAGPDRVRELVDAVLSERPEPAENSLVEQSIRYHLERMVSSCLKADRTRRDDYTIDRTEEPVRFTHRGYEFGGRVDRLDLSSGGRPVVIDYKTGDLKKQAKTLRKYVLESSDHPERRDWQVPLYAAAVAGDGPDNSLAFAYYGIQPGEEPVLITLFIEPADTGIDPESLFSPAPKARFGVLTTGEINGCMDDAAGLAGRIFAPVTEFAKTEALSRCGRCDFRTICGQGEKWN